MQEGKVFNPFKSQIWYNKSDVQLIRADIIEQERSDRLSQQSKWDKFRTNRTVIVDGYIRARKTKLKAEEIVT
jgi:hypothetical protein